MGRGLSNRQVADAYARYGHLVLRRCRVILGDDALAEDALQETFVRVMRYGEAMARADSPLRWLYRVADRCCFDLLRRRRRLREDAAQEPAPPADGEGRLQARSAVRAVLARLGARDREIAVLAFVDGLPQGEIARELGLSRVTINKRLGRIRLEARTLLGGEP